MEFLTQGEIVQITHLSLPTLWRLRKRTKGRFPSPLRVGGRRLLWKRSEVEKWIDEEANQTAQDCAAGQHE